MGCGINDYVNNLTAELDKRKGSSPVAATLLEELEKVMKLMKENWKEPTEEEIAERVIQSNKIVESMWTKQDNDIIVPNDTFKKNVNKKIDLSFPLYPGKINSIVKDFLNDFYSFEKYQYKDDTIKLIDDIFAQYNLKIIFMDNSKHYKKIDILDRNLRLEN